MSCKSHAKFGLRYYDFYSGNSTKQFELNGKPLKLIGTALHDDTAGQG